MSPSWSPLCQCPNFHVYKLSRTLPKKRTLLNSFLLPSPTAIRCVHIVCLRSFSFSHFCSNRGSRAPNQATKRSAEPSRVSTLFTKPLLPPLSHPELTCASHRAIPRPSTGWNDPGFSATWKGSVARPSTGGDAPIVPRNPAISSPHGSFSLSDEGQSGATPNFEGGRPSHP